MMMLRSQVHETDGRTEVQGRANSYALDALKTMGSSLTGPIICNPSGIPLSLKPQGTDAAGFHRMFHNAVNGIAEGLAMPSSSLCPPTSIGVCGDAATLRSAVVGVTKQVKLVKELTDLYTVCFSLAESRCVVRTSYGPYPALTISIV